MMIGKISATLPLDPGISYVRTINVWRDFCFTTIVMGPEMPTQAGQYMYILS